MILPTTSQRHHAGTEYIHTSKIDVSKKGSKKKKKREKERKKNNNTLTTIYIYIYSDSVKKHEVVPVVVISRWWETEGGQGGGYVCSEGERYDNVEQVDTRCIGRRREEKKGVQGRGGGGIG